MKNKILGLLNIIAELIGYKLIKGSEYDKLSYSLHHKTHQKLKHTLSPMDMKKEILTDIKRPIIFDVGAYIGQTVENYLNTFPESKIYAFEPTPISFSELSQKYKDNDKVKCINSAVSQNHEAVDFHLNEFSPTNSMMTSDSRGNKYWGDKLLLTNKTITVSAVTLDIFCQKNKISHIDILKLDVQGAELQVLYGAEELLTNKNITLIYLEVIFVPTYEEQSTYYQIAQYLAGKGYILYGIFNLVYDKRIKQADMIFSTGEYDG